MKYRIMSYMYVEPDDDILFNTLDEAIRQKAALDRLLPEDIHVIDTVPESGDVCITLSQPQTEDEMGYEVYLGK